MRVDYIDVMQLHNPSVEPCEGGDLVTALQETKQQGKVRWIGVSATHPETDIGWSVYDTFQIPCSALEHEHEELIQAASDSRAGVIVRGGVARGQPGAGLGSKDRRVRWEAAGPDDLLDDSAAVGVAIALTPAPLANRSAKVIAPGEELRRAQFRWCPTVGNALS